VLKPVGGSGVSGRCRLALGSPRDDPRKVTSRSTREPNADAAKAIIERLFPAATRHISNTHYGSDWEKKWLRARRVAHKDVLQLYLERKASEDFRAFRDAARALAVAHDEQEFDDYLRALQPERWEKVITALEVYEAELPPDSIIP
jgi:hypothetical protein